MRLGPVNSATYSFANGEMEDEAWTEILQDRENHEISIASSANTNDWDELSEADFGCLDRTWQKFGHMDQWQLVDWTHNPKNVPEWEDPGNSSAPIPERRILQLLGVGNAEEHSQVIHDHRRIDRLFDNI